MFWFFLFCLKNILSILNLLSELNIWPYKWTEFDVFLTSKNQFCCFKSSDSGLNEELPHPMLAMGLLKSKSILCPLPPFFFLSVVWSSTFIGPFHIAFRLLTCFYRWWGSIHAAKLRGWHWASQSFSCFSFSRKGWIDGSWLLRPDWWHFILLNL